MTRQSYQELIFEGIKGLPREVLAEIVDFIFFLRRRALQPQSFEEELRGILLNTELRQLNRDENIHSEKEFEDYDKLYPKE